MLNGAADYGKNGLESKKEEEIRGGEGGIGREGEGKRIGAEGREGKRNGGVGRQKVT